MRLEIEKTRRQLEALFGKTGLKPEDAVRVADNLIAAQMRGVKSHGLIQTANYYEWLCGGVINTAPQMQIIRESACTTAIDADYAPGSVAGVCAMDITIRKAKESGIAMTTVKNGSHFGMAAYYAMRALEDDLIGMAFTSAGHLVAPYGGSGRELGTNPICMAVPAGKERPLVYDGATSMAAFNKIFFASNEKQRIPLDWAVDEKGYPTDDPDIAIEKGALMPFGSYKGYGLNLMVTILTGMLSGTDVHNRQNDDFKHGMRGEGFNFIAVDIAHFTDVDAFKASTDKLVYRMKHAGTRPDVDEILLPGEKEYRAYDDSLKYGLDVDEGTYAMLKTLFEKARITSEIKE